MLAVIHCRTAISKADKWLFVCLAVADGRQKTFQFPAGAFYSRCCLVLLHIKPKSPNICQGYCRCRRSTSTGLLLSAWRWGIADASGVRDPIHGIQHDFSCTICYRGLLCAHQSNQEESGKTAKPFNTFLKLNIYCRPTNSVWTWRTLVLFVYKRYKGKLHLHNIN